MKLMLKLVLINKSYKKKLAHSINLNNIKLAKGKIISKQDISLLKKNKIKKIYVFEMNSTDIDENKASLEISKNIVLRNIEIKKPTNGRTDLYSRINGMLNYNKKILYNINYLNEDLAVAMIKTYNIVKKNQLIGNVKILPYAIQKNKLKKALNTKNVLNFISIIKPTVKNITLIISTNEKNDKTNSKIINSISSRLLNFELKLNNILYCRHTIDDIKKTLLLKKTYNSDLILLYGSTSIVDKNDIIPQGLKKANGRVIAFGAPTDPGNLLLYGKIKETKVIGVPGCAKSILRNGFDLILEKTCFGFNLDKKDIAKMSHGGLFKNLIKKNL
jgi:molybdenum cofactor cytidylyltransferase